MESGISAQMIITLISPLITLTVGTGTVIVLYAGSRLFSLDLAQPEILLLLPFIWRNTYVPYYDYEYI